jgi:hypothetical protein
VDHFRVHPTPQPSDVDAYWVLDQVERVANDNNYLLINLSLGPEIAVEDDEEPHRWTATLDQIAYEREVLFVVAAGNNGGRDAATGLNRVQVPADMVNGISVGACDAPHPESPWERAPYSAVGPGRRGASIQPAGVSFGGTVASPFAGLLGDGRLYATRGTSLATPVVTHGLAALTERLGLRANANTVRAFAVHFAEPHANHQSAEHGHGRFVSDYSPAFDCSEDSVTLLYEDALGRDQVVALPLPVPTGLKTGNVTISWTLVVQAPTEPTEPTEYTKAAIDLTFRPHADRFSYSKRGARTVVLDNVAQAAEAASLLADGYVPSTHPVTKGLASGRGDEADRRDGGKWETVRSGRFRMRSTSLSRPRFDLSHLAREGGLLSRTVPDLRYALLVTVEGPRGSNLYDLVRAQFQVLTPIRVPVTARLSS